MRLFDDAGYGVDLRVTGYQFPDAEDPRQRFSWHMVEGTAVSTQGSWQFRCPAVTCDEPPTLSAWLRAAADLAAGDEPANHLEPLRFTEPNLTIALADWTSETVLLEIAFDLEFSPKWRRRTRAGDAFVITFGPTHEQLTQATGEWDHEIAPYPDEPR